MIHHPRVEAHVSLERIRRNFELIVRQSRKHHADWRGAVPMIKSNGYGHGIVEVGRALARAPSAVALGVATLDEAIQLRSSGVRAPIWVFSDCAPWDETVAAAVHRYRLTPIIHTLSDLRRLVRSRRVPGFHLKFNTGMNRLGLATSETPEALRLVRRLPASTLEGVCTHLASGEHPDARLTRAQGRHFAAVVGELAGLDVSYIHSSNTAAALGAGQTPELARLSNVIRPGIGLYGYSDVPLTGLEPALRLRARVVSGRRLGRGATVGYGATYRARDRRAQSVVAIGYGDGFFRALSGARLRIGGGQVDILGRVSMDLTSLGMSARAGSWVTLLGEDADQGLDMASAAGTIIYEILTAISQRVPRIYERN